MRADQYANLTREQLTERLVAAESVALVYGWCAVHDESERERALLQLWSEWLALCPASWGSPKPHPELDDERLTELADARHARDAAASMRLAALIHATSQS